MSKHRPSRGGGWVNGPEGLRSVSRDSFHQSGAFSDIGFRLVLKKAETNRFRPLRGGSWINYDSNCRSSCRYLNAPDVHNRGIGFRLILRRQHE